jgi:hypothetical protein
LGEGHLLLVLLPGREGGRKGARREEPVERKRERKKGKERGGGDKRGTIGAFVSFLMRVKIPFLRAPFP